MTKRAERLGEFLEAKEWGVFETHEFCPVCKLDRFGKFCNECGTKLIQSNREHVLAMLEEGIKYALKRVDKPAKSEYANGVDPGSFCG